MKRINIALFERIKTQLLAEPQRLYMSSWLLGTDDPRELMDTSSTCRTAGCIAGWACAFADPEADNYQVAVVAQEVLGLRTKQADRLFYLTNWPEQFSDRYLDAPAFSLKRAQITCARIDHFIATGGAE